MTSEAEQKIDDFLDKIRILEMAKNGVEMLQYHAKCSNSNSLSQFNQASNLVNDAYQALIISIGRKQKNDKIAQNIVEAIDIIQNIQDKIPNKKELVKMLETCAESFSSAKMIDIFETLEHNKSLLSQQILLLNELWQSN